MGGAVVWGEVCANASDKDTEEALLDDRNNRYQAWGIDPIVTSPNRISSLGIDAPLKKILGFDRPVGFLAQTGHVHSFDGSKSSEQWDDVSVTGMGAAYAFRGGPLSLLAGAAKI